MSHHRTLIAVAALALMWSWSDSAPASPARTRVELGAMGNATDRRPGELGAVLARVLSQELARVEGIELRSPEATAPEPERAGPRRRSSGYLLTASVTRLEILDNRMVAEISLIVSTSPGGAIRGMLSGFASLSLPRDGVLDEAQRSRLEEHVLRQAARSAVETFCQNFGCGSALAASSYAR